MRIDASFTGDEPIFIAGERAPEGVYQQIGANRQITLSAEDFLPASMDGRVACYMRMPNLRPKNTEERPT